MRRPILAVTLFLAACANAPEQASQETPPAPDVDDDPATAAPAQSASYGAAVAAIGDIANAQYVARNCASAEIPDAAYAGFNVKRCRYVEGGLTGVVYVLNPTAEDVARWIAGACASAGRPEDESCGRDLALRMKQSNGFIFPVAGDVIEPASSAGPTCAGRYGARAVHAYFRDGITVETERGYTCEVYEISEADADAEAFKTPQQVFHVGRIAALHRNDYARLMNVARPSDDEWRAIVRDSYLEALRTGSYSLLNLAARNES